MAFGDVLAEEVALDPAGEITDTNVQDALYALDRRLSKTRLIDDLRVAMTLVDDFMGVNSGPVNTGSASTNFGSIGELGWSLGLSTTGTIEALTLTAFPGVVKLGTGTGTNGFMAINLGSRNLQGSPVFVAEARVRLDQVAAPVSGEPAVYFPLADNLAGQEPTNGCYFRYGPANVNANWWAVCANGGVRKSVDTGVAATTTWTRFRVTSDNGSNVRFYINYPDAAGTPVATIAKMEVPDGGGPPMQVIPSAGAWYSPTFGIRRAALGTARAVLVDYFALRWEVAR